MKYAGGQDGIGLAINQNVIYMFECTGSARCDHRNANRLAHGTGEFDIISCLPAISIPACDQQLAGAEVHRVARPFHRVDPRGPPPPVRQHLPAHCIAFARPARIYGYDDTLRAELVRAFPDQIGLEHSLCIDGYLIRAGLQHLAHVADVAQPAADGERDEYLFRDLLHDLDHCVTSFRRRADIEENKLIGTLFVIECRQLHGVTGIFQVGEARALDHAALEDIEAGYDAFS